MYLQLNDDIDRRWSPQSYHKPASAWRSLGFHGHVLSGCSLQQDPQVGLGRFRRVCSFQRQCQVYLRGSLVGKAHHRVLPELALHKPTVFSVVTRLGGHCQEKLLAVSQDTYSKKWSFKLKERNDWKSLSIINPACANKYHKVNRCLARYTPRATTTNQSTNRAPNEPAPPGPKWTKMPIWGKKS